MARDESLLQKALSLVKPEFRAELEKVMKELAAKWDGLSDDQHEDYYWGNGTIGFVFDDNEDSWKALPSVEELANSEDTEELELEDCILDYICPFEGGEDNSEDVSDEDAFNQSWVVSNPPILSVILDVPDEQVPAIENAIDDCLKSLGIENYTIDREN